MDNTYIKSYRKILHNEVFRHDQTAWHVFECLLFMVDYRDGTWSAPIFVLAQTANQKLGTTYAALKRLESRGMIFRSSKLRSTTISICKWAEYQSDDKLKTNREQIENKLKANPVEAKSSTRNKEIKNINILESLGEEVEAKSQSSPNDLLKMVNRITGRNFRILPERGVKKILDAFTLAEIEIALSNLMNDEWHSEKINEFKLDYLIRGTTIDKFLGKRGKKYWTPPTEEEEARQNEIDKSLGYGTKEVA